MSTETDHDTGSDSSPSSPRHKNPSFSLPLRLSQSRTGPPSSPESDLDVDSAPDDITPENLSLKKDDSRSPPIIATVTPPSDNICKNNDVNIDSRYIDADWTYNFAAILRHAGNNFQGFMPYHQHAQQQYTQLPGGGSGGGGHQTAQRSPVDVLLRVFPTRRRSEVEQLLQKYRGDVVQAMEAMLSGDEMMPPLGLQNSPQPFPVKSAFSPLVPPGAIGSRYPFIQQQPKRFLSAPYAGTGFLSTVIQSENDSHNETNGSNSTTNAGASDIRNSANNGNDTRSIDSQE